MDHDTKPETGSGQSWVYSSLIQTARPIASLAARLGVLPHSYNIIYDRDFLNLHYNREENKRLIDVWEKTRNDRIGFITLQVITQKDNEDKISEMGMSKWRSDGWTGSVSVHCQVEKETAVSESPYPQLRATNFMFGDTEVITESDVGPWLDATFRSFQISQDTTCLVGHDIRRILHLIQPHWTVPSDITILDTRAIWEYQMQPTQHPSLKQTLKSFAPGWDGPLLDNAGNGAGLLIKLFQAQASQAKKSKDNYRV